MKWPAAADRIIEALYPDYEEIQRRLTTRSYCAVRNRAQKLGVAARRHVWTNHKVAKLRRLYDQGATHAELASAFPGLTRSQICSKARHIHLRRMRSEPSTLGVRCLDMIRKRAAILGLTLRELDKIAKTKRYFQRTTRRMDWNHIACAAEALGGRIEITWRHDDGSPDPDSRR
jgi:hypothetical protein